MLDLRKSYNIYIGTSYIYGECFFLINLSYFTFNITYILFIILYRCLNNIMYDCVLNASE
jgi:hypothetical protein